MRKVSIEIVRHKEINIEREMITDLKGSALLHAVESLMESILQMYGITDKHRSMFWNGDYMEYKHTCEDHDDVKYVEIIVDMDDMDVLEEKP